MGFPIQLMADLASVLLVTIVGYVAYYDYTSPRTKLRDKKIIDDGDEFTVQLANAGLTKATLRVRIWVDGENLFEERVDFLNCLYANIPISAPGDGGVFPKRSEVASGDFRQFSTNFHWVPEELPDFPDLPTEDGEHTIRLEVQQTSENYIFEYIADDGEIINLELKNDTVESISLIDLENTGTELLINWNNNIQSPYKG